MPKTTYTNRDGDWPPCPKALKKTKGWSGGHAFTQEKLLSQKPNGEWTKELTCLLCGFKGTQVGFDV